MPMNFVQYFDLIARDDMNGCHINLNCILLCGAIMASKPCQCDENCNLSIIAVLIKMHLFALIA